MESFRLWLKKHHLSTYEKIRGILFPLVHARRINAARHFTKRQIVSLSHDTKHWRMVIDPTNGFVDTHIFTSGVYEPDILTVIAEHLKPGDTFVDIGTNIGQHSLFAASIVGSTGHVVSFEPIPRLVAQFKESITLNQWNNFMTVHECACSNDVGNFALQLKPGNIGGSGFHHTSTDYETITVETIPADTKLGDESRVSFIKIDTEGHELEALQGLTKTLHTHHPILLVEFSPCFWGDDAATKSALFFEILTTNNYTILDLEDGHKEVTDTKNWFTNFTKLQTNLLCLPH